MAPWRRIASSSDSAQPSPITEVSSHSSNAWRRKMPSAVARPAGVRCKSRPPAWATRPSATRRRNISLAAWVVTPSWRAIWAVVARPRSSEPTSTRSARRYSWAALDRSRWSCRRGGMSSGYGTGRRRRCARPPGDGDADPGDPRDEEDGAERGPPRLTVGSLACRGQNERGCDGHTKQRDRPHRGDRPDHGEGKKAEERSHLKRKDQRVREPGARR